MNEHRLGTTLEIDGKDYAMALREELPWKPLSHKAKWAKEDALKRIREIYIAKMGPAKAVYVVKQTDDLPPRPVQRRLSV